MFKLIVSELKYLNLKFRKIFRVMARSTPEDKYILVSGLKQLD